MEWNVKWDWGNLVMFGSKACGSPKELQLTDWGAEGEGELDAGSFNLSGSGSGYGSDVGNGSSIKSSISATDSSTKEGLKASNFTFEAFDCSPRKLRMTAEPCSAGISRNSLPMEASIGFVEPMIGLKLGKRAFETIGGGGSDIPMTPVSSAAAVKKTKSSQNAPIPRCQVEGCNLDLSSAKEYHRKHRVCDNHSKCQKVIVAGVERRFCQQCSRFHGLSEFDEKKRSCRKRLSDHNARRRKPQQETIHFNSTRLSSSYYDNRQPMNLLYNSAPLIHSKPVSNSTWECTQGSKFSITRELTSITGKAGSTSGQSLLAGIQLPRANGVHSIASSLLLASKGTTAEVFRQVSGVRESMFSSNMGTTPELPRALSLLSTNPWDETEPGSVSVNHPMHANKTDMPQQQMMHAVPQGFPHVSSDFWQAEQHTSDPRVNTLAANNHSGYSFQGTQLFKAPFDTDFYVNALN